MKKIGSYLVLQFFFFLSFGQTDSLKLNLTYEPVYADSEIRSNLRLDFISFKKEPISFYNRAHYLLECGFDDIGINIEVLENNCFRSFEFSECMLLPDIKRSNENVKVLKYGDTVTYTHYCSYIESPKNRRLVGVYRVRLYRYYNEKDKRKTIFSNWVYAVYPEHDSKK